MRLNAYVDKCNDDMWHLAQIVIKGLNKKTNYLLTQQKKNISKKTLILWNYTWKNTREEEMRKNSKNQIETTNRKMAETWKKGK